MGDLIHRDELKQTLLDLGFYPAIVKSALEKAPTIDAVEVVRCKDCVSHGNCDSERVFTFYCGISNPFCCAGRWKRNG